MNRLLPIIMIVLLVVFIAAGTSRSGLADDTSTPEGIVQSFYSHVKADDYRKAYTLVAPSSNVDFNTMYRDIAVQLGKGKTSAQRTSLLAGIVQLELPQRCYEDILAEKRARKAQDEAITVPYGQGRGRRER